MLADQQVGGAIIAIGQLGGMTGVIWKLVDFVKLVSNLPSTARHVVTQLLTWVAAIGAVWVYAASGVFGTTVKLTDAGLTLNQADTPTKLLVGFALGSAASIAVDFKKARDNSDSASIPSLPIGQGPVPPNAADVAVDAAEPPAPPAPPAAPDGAPAWGGGGGFFPAPPAVAANWPVPNPEHYASFEAHPGE